MLKSVSPRGLFTRKAVVEKEQKGENQTIALLPFFMLA